MAADMCWYRWGLTDVPSTVAEWRESRHICVTLQPSSTSSGNKEFAWGWASQWPRDGLLNARLILLRGQFFFLLFTGKSQLLVGERRRRNQPASAMFQPNENSQQQTS